MSESERRNSGHPDATIAMRGGNGRQRRVSGGGLSNEYRVGRGGVKIQIISRKTNKKRQNGGRKDPKITLTWAVGACRRGALARGAAGALGGDG